MTGEDTAYSVSELAAALKGTIEKSFGAVRVRGELGRIASPPSGHKYFDLKDADALINAVWFKGAQRSRIELSEGLEVIVSGKLSTYPARSNYQLIVSAIEPAGIGALLKLIEERKKKLAAEGLFEQSRKRQIPFLPRVIGVITSPSGAVIHDILHRLQERYFPRVLLWPVMVQGEGAAAQVVDAVRGFNAFSPEDVTLPRPDVLIVARGGGSVEDLMPFNDEALVRAVAASAIPVISAIGHETDWTLIDFAADLRAPTPTGAAELAVPVKAQLTATLADLQARLAVVPLRRLQEMRARLPDLRPPRNLLDLQTQRLDELSLRLTRGLHSWLQVRRLHLERLHLRSPRDVLQVRRDRLLRLGQALSPQLLSRATALPRQRLDLLTQRLTPAQVKRAQERPAQRVQLLGEKLEVLSYEKTLQRGYSVVRGSDGHAVTLAAQAGSRLEIQFADGRIDVQRIEKP